MRAMLPIPPRESAKILKDAAKTNAKNSDIALAELFHSLIEGVFGKRVHAAGQHHNGLLTLHVLQAIHGLEKSIENVRFTEPREIKMIDAVENFIFILSKIHLDARLHIKGFERDPVLLLQIGK